MTRFLAAVGTPIALLALFAGLQHPVLFLYYLGLALVLGGVGGYAAASVFRNERDKARMLLASEREQHEAECDLYVATIRTAAADIASLEAEAERLHLALTESQLLAGHTPRALSLVEPRDEMDDSWLELLVTRPKPFGDVS